MKSDWVKGAERRQGAALASTPPGILRSPEEEEITALPFPQKSSGKDRHRLAFAPHLRRIPPVGFSQPGEDPVDLFSDYLSLTQYQIKRNSPQICLHSEYFTHLLSHVYSETQHLFSEKFSRQLRVVC